jgi:hypothetical protein
LQCWWRSRYHLRVRGPVMASPLDWPRHPNGWRGHFHSAIARLASDCGCAGCELVRPAAELDPIISSGKSELDTKAFQRPFARLNNSCGADRSIGIGEHHQSKCSRHTSRAEPDERTSIGFEQQFPLNIKWHKTQRSSRRLRLNIQQGVDGGPGVLRPCPP